MDRHVKWLRRRIIASIATQTAETFALVAVVAFALMYWRTNEGPLSSLLAAFVIAQLVALARIGHAMRNNPLNYVYMRKYIDSPFNYRVTRFQLEEEAHDVAEQLVDFSPVATVRDPEAEPSPVFDVFHDTSRVMAASLSRASGSVALISSLADGRILVTDSRALPPHERLVMNLATSSDIPKLIASHQRALAQRTDVVELASSAHQVVLDSLAIEYESYAALGPVISPFLELEPQGRASLRLVARVDAKELAEIPERLGTDEPIHKVRTAAESSTSTVPAAAAVAPPESAPVPTIAAPTVEAPQVAAPPAPVQVPEPVAASIPHVVAPPVAPVAIPEPAMAEVEIPAPPAVVAPISPVVAPATIATPDPVVELPAPPGLQTIPAPPAEAQPVAAVAPVTEPVPDAPIVSVVPASQTPVQTPAMADAAGTAEALIMKSVAVAQDPINPMSLEALAGSFEQTGIIPAPVPEASWSPMDELFAPAHDETASDSTVATAPIPPVPAEPEAVVTEPVPEPAPVAPTFAPVSAPTLVQPAPAVFSPLPGSGEIATFRTPLPDVSPVTDVKPAAVVEPIAVPVPVPAAAIAEVHPAATPDAWAPVTAEVPVITPDMAPPTVTVTHTPVPQIEAETVESLRHELPVTPVPTPAPSAPAPVASVPPAPAPVPEYYEATPTQAPGASVEHVLIPAVASAAPGTLQADQPDLAAAFGYDADESAAGRPRLSAIIRANEAGTAAAQPKPRSRRKFR